MPKARAPAHEVLSDEEMDKMNSLIIMDNNLYDKSADSGPQVVSIIQDITSNLAEPPKKIRLSDLTSVVTITKRYVSSCLRSGVIPSKSGLSRSLGFSRAGLNKFMAKNPESESTEYLQMVFDAFAEVLEMAALTGKTQPILSIFILKAVYNYSEQPEEIDVPYDPLDPKLTVEEILSKYGDLPDPD